MVYYPRHDKKTCSRKCGGELLSQASASNQIVWRHNDEGYLVATIVRNRVRINLLQHRYLMERHLGRSLSKDEVVHHKNGVRDDNRLENLEVRGRSEHASEHGRKRKGLGGWKQNLTPQQRKTISDRIRKLKVWEYSSCWKRKKTNDGQSDTSKPRMEK